ncbi:hypothetical protein J4401_07175 [Candidatus Woesearchaeota archaeon]|nr:hypothetical protein [Candidatus Woesearchaeota archaeon]
MGQAETLEFLQNYKRTKAFKKRPWLPVRDIHIIMHRTFSASGLGSLTNSVKKLRECGMIKWKEKELEHAKSLRKIYHYQA